jgi:hypothetical protein
MQILYSVLRVKSLITEVNKYLKANNIHKKTVTRPWAGKLESEEFDWICWRHRPCWRIHHLVAFQEKDKERISYEGRARSFHSHLLRWWTLAARETKLDTLHKTFLWLNCRNMHTVCRFWQ